MTQDTSNGITLVQVLRSGRQADPDGVEVRISRQAVEEAAYKLERLDAELLEAKRQRNDEQRLRLSAEATSSGWLKANAPGGWIDDLRRAASAHETRDSGVLPDARLIRSALFQQFMRQGFWHAHHVDLVWRYDGEDIREEADWLKDVWYALRGTEKASAPPTVSQQMHDAGFVRQPRLTPEDTFCKCAEPWWKTWKDGTTYCTRCGFAQQVNG